MHVWHRVPSLVFDHDHPRKATEGLASREEVVAEDWGRENAVSGDSLSRKLPDAAWR